jgi:hypothetical protein
VLSVLLGWLLFCIGRAFCDRGETGAQDEQWRETS